MNNHPVPSAKPPIVVIDEAQLLIGGTPNSGKSLPPDLIDAIQRINATEPKES